jgi:hypothetical protein
MAGVEAITGNLIGFDAPVSLPEHTPGMVPLPPPRGGVAIDVVTHDGVIWSGTAVE